MDLQKTVTGSEPLTESEVKNYLKIDYTADDYLIDDLITATREMAEEFTGRSLVAKTIVMFESDYEQTIYLPYPDHNTVTAITQNGTDILSDCLITGNYEKRIQLPTVYDGISSDNDGVQITYTTLGNCPKGIKIALLKNIAEIYEKRGNTFEGSIAELTDNTTTILQRFMLI